MFAQLNRLSVRNRIWGIVLIFIGSIVLGSAIDVMMLKETLRQEKESAIRQVVDSGYSVLAHYERLEWENKLSRDEAQAAALSTIKSMRYNQDDYFWINDNQKPAHMIMHPIIPALDGQTLVDEKYNRATSLRNGSEGPFTLTDGRKNLTVAFAEAVAKTGDGYVTYLWFKAHPEGGNTEEMFPKLSYVKEFTPWGWIIGSGIYIDDIDAAVQNRAIQNLILLLGASTVLLLLASLIARSITHPLQTTMQAMHDIARSKTGLEQRVPVEGRSEITQLARNFNEMLDHIQSRDQALLKHQEKLEDEVASRTISLRDANLKLDGELTERKLTELALLSSEERFRGIASVAQDAIIMMDALGNISFWNPAAEKIFGYSREETLGRELHKLITPERYYQAFCRGHQYFSQTGQGVAVGKTLELYGRRKNGNEFPIEISLSAIRLNDSWSSVGILRDISERKHQEKVLQDNLEQMQRLNKQLEDAQNQLLQSEKMASIGQLAAGVAHEINNPMGFVSANLGALKGYANDLLGVIDAYAQADPLLASHPEINSVIARAKEQADLEFVREDIQVLLRESHDGVDRVTKIIRNLRDFSRIDSEDWAMLNLEQALDNTVNIVANEIRDKADVVREYGSTPAIECLGAQLNQVFMNLLLNAAQAIESHGTITLRTGATESMVWVEIADSGRGIPPENLKRIFEPFFTTRAVGQGTGLGLSLAYSIVQKHHGKLDVSSQVGSGTCFRIEIPRIQPAPPANPQALA